MIIDLIQQIKDRYHRGIEDRSTNLRNRLVYKYMVPVRSLLIYQQINKNKKTSEYNYTDIPCIELERVPDNLCPCAVPSGCFMFRTKLKIPELMNHRYADSISYLTSTDRKVFFDQIEIDQIDMFEENGNKYGKNNPKFFYSNEYLYFPTVKHIKYVSGGFLLKDPSDAIRFKCDKDIDDDCLCAYDKTFSINPELEKALIDLTLQSLQGFNKQYKDSRNDSQ